jgi:hypothetical protein
MTDLNGWAIGFMPCISMKQGGADFNASAETRLLKTIGYEL